MFHSGTKTRGDGQQKGKKSLFKISWGLHALESVKYENYTVLKCLFACITKTQTKKDIVFKFGSARSDLLVGSILKIRPVPPVLCLYDNFSNYQY